MATAVETRMLNEKLYEYMRSDNPTFQKKAADTLTMFTRMRVREDSFYDRVIPALTVTNDDLDRTIEDDKPSIIFEKEPGGPPAVTFPFAKAPIGLYLRAQRYRVTFNRILSRKFIKDVDELRTYRMDLRQVVSDNAIKDMHTEKDTKFISGFNTAVGALDSVVNQTGSVHFKTIPGGISRESMEDSFKILPECVSRFEVATVLLNNITIREVMKFGRDEFGGDMSQEVFRDGWTAKHFMNAEWVVTIKTELVPHDNFFFFANPEGIGKNLLLEDTVMYVDRKAFMMEFWAYKSLGGAIGNTGGIARAFFN